MHTVSEPVRRWFLRRNKPVETTLVLRAELLFVVARVEGREHVMVYRLSEIEVRPFASELIADVGLELSGTQIGASERSVAFLPVDEGPDGSGFRTALGAALERARVG